jgi:hypothetical protein
MKLTAIRTTVSQFSSIERDGFAIASGVLDERTRLDLLWDVEGLLLEFPAGVRGLAAKVPSVAAVARSASVRQSHLRGPRLRHEKSWRPMRDADGVQRPGLGQVLFSGLGAGVHG